MKKIDYLGKLYFSKDDRLTTLSLWRTSTREWTIATRTHCSTYFKKTYFTIITMQGQWMGFM